MGAGGNGWAATALQEAARIHLPPCANRTKIVADDPNGKANSCHPWSFKKQTPFDSFSPLCSFVVGQWVEPDQWGLFSQHSQPRGRPRPLQYRVSFFRECADGLHRKCWLMRPRNELLCFPKRHHTAHQFLSGDGRHLGECHRRPDTHTGFSKSGFDLRTKYFA